ncbi:MAG: HNH endonuclease [Bdellovibrionaceae bacterium]|nr:HNH endonuclease [Pseudobdellovibrionaceae bacterium]
MTFEELKDFLLHRMRMTGPYQPVIIRRLLLDGGRSSLSVIAKDVAIEDPDVEEYFVDRLKSYPKTVLKKHGIATIPNKQDFFEWVLGSEGPPRLTPEQIRELVEICNSKLKQWAESRSSKNEDSFSGWGRLRVEILKETPFCELCGARPSKTNDVRLHVDHIVPVSKGGDQMDRANLQVLCSKCNGGKSNHFAMSVRDSVAEYGKFVEGCKLCSITSHNQKSNPLAQINETHLKGSAIVVPCRHVTSFEDLSLAELRKMMDLAQKFVSRGRKNSRHRDFKISFANSLSPAPTGVPHIHLRIDHSN